MTAQCLDKDIQISPVKGRAHVLFDGAEIGSSKNALQLDEPGHPLRIYFPRDDIQPGILEETETRTHCPYKGEAWYCTIKTLTATGPDQVFYYPEPCPQVASIQDMLCFWGDKVEVRYTEV